MRVTMIEDRNAAPDGVTVERLLAGESYDLPDGLAADYVERGQAVEEKALPAAPANKDAGRAPENKAAAAKRSARERGQAVEAKADVGPPGNKDAGAAPENKDAGAAPSNKRAPSKRLPRGGV